MYYAGLTSYDFIPSSEDLQKLKATNKIAVFDNGNLPDYIKNDPAVFKITEQLK